MHIMYVPGSNMMNEADVRAFVGQVGAAEFITVDSEGHAQATFLPIVWEAERPQCIFAGKPVSSTTASNCGMPGRS